MSAEPKILIVSPVRNEADHIERVIDAVAAQELKPARWIVIDDASTDGTFGLIKAAAERVPFMEVTEAPRDVPHAGARDRLARAAAPRNFNAGLATADWTEYTHIMKLDGDIELPPSYLRELLARFDADPTLGIAGGVLVETAADGTSRRLPIPRHHVHGALKCYSRECFGAIGGVYERLAWDTIDEVYARMRGYATVTFEELVSVHNRCWGTADGALRGRVRLGECAYITHYPLLWVTLRSVKLGLRGPRMFGAAYLYGYVRAAARGTARVDDAAYRHFTRRELRQRMLRGVVPSRLRASTGT